MRKSRLALLVDCDGVLVNSEEIAQAVELELLTEIGLTYERREFAARFMGTSERTFWEGLDADARSRLGRAISRDVRPELDRRMRVALSERLAEVPGASAALARVPWPKAVASSSSAASLRRKMERVGHWTLFAPHIYSADDVPNPKPAPDLFQHAAARLGVSTTACIVIEDSLNGVRSGRAAGMRVWGFTGAGHHLAGAEDALRSAGAERIVTSWVEAAALFDAM